MAALLTRTVSGAIVQNSDSTEGSSPRGVKRGRKAKKTTLRNGTLVQNSVIDGVLYKCAISIGGYLVDMCDADVDPESVMESAVKTGHARECTNLAVPAPEPEPPASNALSASALDQDVLGLPNGARVQKSELCGKIYEDAIVVDGRLVEIAELPDDATKAVAVAGHVYIRESKIDANNLFLGEWVNERTVVDSTVAGKKNRIHGSMTNCRVVGNSNIFTSSIDEVIVSGSKNEIHTPLRSCQIHGSRNVLNAGFVKSHIRGNNNTFEKGLENSYVTGSKNEFKGNVVNSNITGDKNKFGGDLSGCVMECSETEIGV